MTSKEKIAVNEARCMIRSIANRLRTDGRDFDVYFVRSYVEELSEIQKNLEALLR